MPTTESAMRGVTGEDVSGYLLPRCVCGSASVAVSPQQLRGIPVQQCAQCGIVRQEVYMTPDVLRHWYRYKYFDGVYTHTYEHDCAVAEQRLDAYAIPVGKNLLDVGSGNGAFVRCAMSRGLNAWGQDLAEQGSDPHVYVGPLEEVAFPAERFDVVTIHDVLEHWVDPLAALRECHRVLGPQGQLIVDFPRFFHESGAHHWKLVEHLWMLDEDQLVALIQRAGFTVTAVEHPIPSKVVVRATRGAVSRPTILVPSGIGDAYWVMTKLPGFLRQHGLPDSAEVFVQDSGGPKRTHPFLQTIPFVKSGGYRDMRGRQFNKLWDEAYMRDGRTVYPGVGGLDYFIAYNGVLRHGRSLEGVDPSFGVEWFPRMHVSKEAEEMRKVATADGPYVVAYFVSAGMYQRWLREFPVPRILESLRYIRSKGYRILFVGAEWDKGSVGMTLASAEPADASWVNLIGQTSYDQLHGLLRGASGIVGWPSGATLLGPVLRVPTALVWNDYFKTAFWENSCPPRTPYATLDSKAAGADPAVLWEGLQRAITGPTKDGEA